MHDGSTQSLSASSVYMISVHVVYMEWNALCICSKIWIECV